MPPRILKFCVALAVLRWLRGKKIGFWRAVLPGDDTPERNLDYYHRIHPTWVCTQALRDRDFKVGAGANAFWPDFIAKVLRETQFHTLLYKPGW